MTTDYVKPHKINLSRLIAMWVQIQNYALDETWFDILLHGHVGCTWKDRSTSSHAATMQSATATKTADAQGTWKQVYGFSRTVLVE